MKIELVDILEEDPQARSGKFVLIEHDGNYRMLRSSMQICEYHARIVARYAAMHGIDVRLNRDASDLLERPAQFQIHGGGYWEQREDRDVRLYAKSAAFGHFDQSLILGLGIDSPLRFFIDS